jgi:hypothetical protein
LDTGPLGVLTAFGFRCPLTPPPREAQFAYDKPMKSDTTKGTQTMNTITKIDGIRPALDELVPSRYALRVGEIDVLVISDGVVTPPAHCSAGMRH